MFELHVYSKTCCHLLQLVVVLHGVPSIITGDASGGVSPLLAEVLLKHRPSAGTPLLERQQMELEGLV